MNIHEIGRAIERMEKRFERVERLLLRIVKEEIMTKQSTQDLTDAVAGLVTTTNEVGAAIDALVAAHEDDDSAAVEAQVAILKGLGPQLKAHLPTVADAGTAAVQAQPDPGAPPITVTT